MFVWNDNDLESRRIALRAERLQRLIQEVEILRKLLLIGFGLLSSARSDLWRSTVHLLRYHRPTREAAGEREENDTNAYTNAAA